MAKRYLILVNLSNNTSKKNKEVLGICRKEVSLPHVVKASGTKILIDEVLFEAIQYKVELAKPKNFSFFEDEDDQLVAIASNFKVMSPQYDDMLRILRFRKE